MQHVAHRASDEIRQLKETNAELLEALIKLTNEAAGWSGYELELRQIAGNTNFVSLMERVHEARAAIAEATEQS